MIMLILIIFGRNVNIYRVLVRVGCFYGLNMLFYERICLLLYCIDNYWIKLILMIYFVILCYILVFFGLLIFGIGVVWEYVIRCEC